MTRKLLLHSRGYQMHTTKWEAVRQGVPSRGAMGVGVLPAGSYGMPGLHAT